MVGEGFAGVTTSAFRIVTKAFVDDLHKSSIAFFLICIVIIVGCLINAYFLTKSPFVNTYVGKGLKNDLHRGNATPSNGFFEEEIYDFDDFSHMRSSNQDIELTTLINDNNSDFNN
eukprot:Pgem_evm1s15821